MGIALKIYLLFSYFTLYRSFRKSPAEAEAEEEEEKRKSDEIVEKKIAEEVITEKAIPEKAIMSEEGI